MQPGPYAPTGPAPVAGGPAQQIGPSKWWFVVAGLLAVVGIVAGIAIIVAGVVRWTDRIDDLTRADLPTDLEVEITDTGGYSVYHEYDGAADDFGFSTAPTVTVTDPSGDTVDLDDYSTSVTYSTGDHEGEGLYTFDADETGTYVVTADGEIGDGIAVGRGIGGGLVASILGGLAVGAVLVLAGAVLAIVVGVKRASNRRALRPPPQFGAWGPPPPPGGYGTPGYGPPGGYGPPPGYGPPGGYGPPPGYGPPGGYGPPPGYGPPGGYGPPPHPPPPSRPADAAPADRPADGPTDATSRFAGAPAPTVRPSARRGVVHDPPSLRAPQDWARGDVPLRWSPGR